MSKIEAVSISLADVLAAKEQRQYRQKLLLDEYGLTLVSITINMPGAVKDSILIRMLCDFAVAAVKKNLPVCAEQIVYLPTGPEALIVTSTPAEQAKKICAAIEGDQPFARLFDLDVCNAQGELLSAQNSRGLRKCYICGKPAVYCMREAKHSQIQIQQAVQGLFNQFLAEQSRCVSAVAEQIASLAVEAMLYEVTCTPSPGLVDRANSEAHQDMDFYTFMASTAALSSTMARFAQAGMNFTGDFIVELLPVLRMIGQEGEQAMFKVTENVNTQKGLIFSLGIVTASVAFLLKNNQFDEQALYETVAQMTAGMVRSELASREYLAEEKLTAGEKLYRRYRIAGIRGEFEQGLPAVRLHSLPQLRLSLGCGLAVNEALLETLLRLMTCVDDTTVMNRHSPEKMRHWVKQQVEPVFAVGGLAGAEGKKLVAVMDQTFIEQNVSPGGAADLLAVTWFIYRVNQKWGSG
jgi:holo-ACP synthase/triphosphoribosyl-dephospho-CoA synthase